jgi:hypothetical protein
MEREAVYSRTCIISFKNAWSLASTPRVLFHAWCSGTSTVLPLSLLKQKSCVQVTYGYSGSLISECVSRFSNQNILLNFYKICYEHSDPSLLISYLFCLRRQYQLQVNWKTRWKIARNKDLIPLRQHFNFHTLVYYEQISLHLRSIFDTFGSRKLDHCIIVSLLGPIFMAVIQIPLVAELRVWNLTQKFWESNWMSVFWYTAGGFVS